jgi:hypothetical protein
VCRPEEVPSPAGEHISALFEDLLCGLNFGILSGQIGQF